MVNFFIHLINMQIMRNPQWGWGLIKCSISGKPEMYPEKNHLSACFPTQTLMLLYYNRFYSDRFRNNFLHAQTVASAYFLNREVSYWLQSSITGSVFRGFILIIQNNSMLKDTKIFRHRVGAFRCIAFVIV